MSQAGKSASLSGAARSPTDKRRARSCGAATLYWTVLNACPGLGWLNQHSRRQNAVVLPVWIEHTTSPLPRECSTTELRQQRQAPGTEQMHDALAGADMP